jgi:hypothetical protein
MERQLRLGDILDDYCPRERRVTNHAVVAMVGPDVKQTRCSTCETEHEYKHAKVPRQRRKSEKPAALYTQVAATGPKRVAHEPALAIDPARAASEPPLPIDRDSPAAAASADADWTSPVAPPASIVTQAAPAAAAADAVDAADAEVAEVEEIEDGPVHRPLIRATLPRQEGQPPPSRPAPDFTIRQPGGRLNRFRPRHQQGGQQFFGNRSNGNTSGGSPTRGGAPRPHGGRPPHGQGQGHGHGQGPQGPTSRLARRNGPGRKPSK